MRIVGGRLRGRRFAGPPTDRTRPTSERVREAQASALEAHGAVADRRVLDLFAGTGALSFEALSRGARHALLVEKDGRTARALAQSARNLGLTGQVRVLREDLRRGRTAARLADAPEGPFELVFADPPYADADLAVRVLANLARSGGLAEEAILVLEHAKKTALALPADLVQVAHYRYGDSAITWLRHRAPGERPSGERAS